MDVLTIDGKNYVKSSVIGRELGYTSDYVGQLCRSGKVDAKLFGRTWYVEKDSIGGHKNTRYRSTNAVTKKALQIKNTPTEIDSDIQEVIEPKSKFYSHVTQKAVPRYTPDQTELMPQLGTTKPKAGILQVNLADAVDVPVHSDASVYAISTPKLPKVHFKGELQVTEFEEGSVIKSDTKEITQQEKTPKSDTGFHIHPKEVEHFKQKHSNKTAHNKVSSAIQVLATKDIEVENISKDTPDQHATPVQQQHAELIPALGQSASVSVWLLSAAFSCSLAIAILSAVSASRIDVSDSAMNVSYVLDPETPISILKNYLR